MGNVGPWAFEEMLRGIDGVGGEWQAVVRQEGRRDVVELQVEAEDLSRQPAIEAAVHANLQARLADFWRNHEMRLYDLRIRTCRAGSLRGTGRKLRRVVDERRMADGHEAETRHP
jgi:phenylacetate-coenzyme A ligase PaaK-like adenylate-forming protein